LLEELQTRDRYVAGTRESRMKVTQRSHLVCPKCGHTFASRQMRMSELKRLGAARVRALDKVELLAELQAVRDYLDDMRAKVSRMRKHDARLRRMANIGRLGREHLRESLDGARAKIRRLSTEERALLARLRKLEA
jgi:ribosomal 50S subunit-associated protein YjgA (DUF615 family)